MKKFFLLPFVFLLVIISAQAQSFQLRGETISFDGSFEASRISQDQPNGWYYRLAHFEAIPASSQRARLVSQGVVFISYYWDNTYLVATQTSFDKQECIAIGMDGLKIIPLGAKLSTKMKEHPVPAWAQTPRNGVKVVVKGYDTESPTHFAKAIREAGFIIHLEGKYKPYVQLTILMEQINELAALPGVATIDWIGEPGHPEDYNGRGMHRSSVLNATYPGGRHYDGTGVNVLVRDDGAVGPHIDFKNRLFQTNLGPGGTHGDMVTGILGGAGNINPRYEGMASGADIFVREQESSFELYTLGLHLNNHVLVTSTSYSNGCNSGYTSSTNTVDQQVYEHHSLEHVFSAGNSGGLDCNYGIIGWGNITGGHKQGKNVIATGNLGADEVLENSSSRGPAYDGRIKPDLCAYGQGQMSTDPDNIYSAGGGTSAAAPGVAGVFTQLIQAYRTLNDGADPNSGLIKACLLNTAMDLGNTGPDFKYGWGEINGYRAVKILEDGTYLKDSIDQNGSNTHSINVASGMTQVRFMLYWVDPPAVVDAPKALVNNLDLKVISPSGDTILPWVLDPTPIESKLNAPATHGVDDLNNMEQVLFDTPEAGTYLILVDGTEVPMGPQEYFIVTDKRDEALFVVSPVGGEHLEPGDDIRIFWDYYGSGSPTFTVKLSTDGGNSWTTLGNTSNTKLLWTVPSTPTGEAYIQVVSGSMTATSTYKFSIMASPTGLAVDTVCADKARISWDATPNASTYSVFKLGEKYMDSITSSAVNYAWIPNENPFGEFWYSANVTHSDGAISERAYAKQYLGGIKNCVIHHDLSLDSIVDLSNSDFFICGSQVIPLQFLIRNTGSLAMSNFVIQYSKNNGANIETTYTGTIEPGDVLLWDTNDSLILDASGYYSVSARLIKEEDEISINDEKNVSFFVENLFLVENGDISEDFEGAVFPPSQWSVEYQDGSGWGEQHNIIGIDGLFSTVSWVNNYSESDLLTTLSTEVVNTTSTSDFVLLFDYAYSNYDGYYDSLKIVVQNDCSGYSDVVFYKGGDDLRTIPEPSSELWIPESQDDWGHKEVVITNLEPGTAKLNFINIGGYGNSLFLDNIQLQGLGILAEKNVLCVGEEGVFSTFDFDNKTYQWDFGNGVSPTGPGPHNVSYNEAGVKNIVLYISEGSEIDTFYYSVEVVTSTIADFDPVITSNTVNFTNNSTGEDTYFWTFGDGSSSTEENPTHIYNEVDTYNACLMVTGACGQDTICQAVEILTGLESVNELEHLWVSPNPTSDVFTVTNAGSSLQAFRLAIFDVTGRVVYAGANIELGQDADYQVDVSSLSSGIYSIRLQSKAAVFVVKLIVE